MPLDQKSELQLLTMIQRQGHTLYYSSPWITPFVAKHIVQSARAEHCAICFSWLRTLSLEVAQELRQARSLLDLPSLTTVEPQVASELAKTSASQILMTKVAAMPDATFEALASFSGVVVTDLDPLDSVVLERLLSQNSIKTIREFEIDTYKPSHAAYAKIVAEEPLGGTGWKGHVSTRAKTISPEFAHFLTTLGYRNSRSIKCFEVESISEEVAAIWAGFQGPINLQKLTVLPATKEHLAFLKCQVEKQGRFDTSNLANVPIEVAELLARSRHAICLNGLQHLPVEIAMALEGHVGRLELNGLRSITDQCAGALARHSGPISLLALESFGEGIGHSALVAKLATSEEFELMIPARLTHLSDDVAKAFSKWNRGEKQREYFSPMQEISDLDGHLLFARMVGCEASKPGSRRKVIIHFGNLQSLSAKAAKRLINPCPQQNPEIDLVFHEFTNPSQDTLEDLASHHGRIAFNKIASIPVVFQNALEVGSIQLEAFGVRKLSHRSVDILNKKGQAQRLSGGSILVYLAA